jgi:hypothetical protein
MNYPDIAEQYLAERRVSTHYAACVRRVAKRCPTPTVEKLNRYLMLRLNNAAGTTVKFERTILLSLWRWAYDRSLVEIAPRGVARLKARRKPTKAWSQEQIRDAINATHAHDSQRLRSGASLGRMLRAWSLLGYECGGRYGDLWSLTAASLDGDAISWTQSKTGDPIVRILTPTCLTAVREMLADSPDGRILGWACQRRQAMRLMREHLDRCGIGGTSKWLRRSGATHIEINEPGKARHHLGHRTAGLAERNYIDWSQVRANAPRTPDLMG